MAKTTRSRLKVGQGYFGPIEEDIWSVLSHCLGSPQAVASNFARTYASAFALAASMGWLSVVEPDGQSYTRSWKVTPEGAFALRNREQGT